jgi:hypothetical protein
MEPTSGTRGFIHRLRIKTTADELKAYGYDIGTTDRTKTESAVKNVYRNDDASNWL